MTDDVGQMIRDRQKAMWALGDYRVIAERLEPAAHALLDACGVGPGMRVLDVGTGTGNAALEAARRGAEVTACDIGPSLMDIAKERASAENLTIEWHEADAENLPFPDGTFDVVTSVFAAMFAPNAEAAASGLLRVTKPRGIASMTTWTNDGYNGELFRHAMQFQPPPPEGVATPADWGDEQAARSRFEAVGAEVSIDRGSIHWRFDSMEEGRRWLLEKAPPLVAARMNLPPEKFEEMMAGYAEIQERYNEGVGGTVDIPAEYFMIVARRT